MLGHTAATKYQHDILGACAVFDVGAVIVLARRRLAAAEAGWGGIYVWSMLTSFPARLECAADPILRHPCVMMIGRDMRDRKGGQMVVRCKDTSASRRGGNLTKLQRRRAAAV